MLLVSTIGPVLVTLIAARLIAVLKVADEMQKLEIEARLRDALHQSAVNGLKLALRRSRITAVASNIVTRDMVSEAMT
ncbi:MULTISPECIES: hypothetical protein [unclassified Rhizobium]|uniref:hypothetical protein n=1 Tax=unclassified Rhizobium TaxID=2613769 RepID=UPI001AE67F02|nr:MULTISPECIES: hypothetical protein [unclassified Rhizobium]MBP2460158.1 hypothetical protein [Rhizobium sp. PvP014]MBP2531517.1 hypothetical protein [Rhizobium sp. PvP099]